ncbi:HAUS augmin-like complex subunit 6 [Lonchura striata]|uniref:HAUS augmin-like complex subunit 6 n=1 Tax=Lonchura striata TaxID=40157 RepID=A0A218UJL3_9PASE|nr:HAUS augmin-like complex subunit 6 [Lonchura striata domestica]
MAALGRSGCAKPRAAAYPEWEGEHLWIYLLALGFDPKRYKDVRLGRDMFAKPNSKAIFVVAYFLFSKLDKHRAKQTFKVLAGEIERTKSEYAVVWEEFRTKKQNDQNKNDTTERIQKVHSMWTLIVEMLTSLKKEKGIVDSVLEDCVNPCVLDGADVAFVTENLYEDGNLNFLTVIQLLNEALNTLRDEHCPCELKELHRIEDMVTYYKNALQELKTESLRRKQEHYEPKHQSIAEKQEIWESKWKTVLGRCPFNLIWKDYVEPVSSCQSFSSSDEEEDSVFYQSFPDYDDYDEECLEECDETMIDTTLVPSICLSPLRSSLVPSSSEASENGDLSIENNLNTFVGNEKPVPQKNLKNGKEEIPTSEVDGNAYENVTQPKSVVKKDDLLEKARDELAEEIAKLVMSESPYSGEEKGMALDVLISSLCFNPFLTRKEIPRTPENLLTEVRSSWRKAIQTEDSLDLELSSTEVVTEESSVNATLSMQEEVDSMCSERVSPVSDLGPPVSEQKFQLNSTESSSQEQVSVSHTLESSDSKTSGIQETERTESEEQNCSALSGSSVKDLSQTLKNVEKSMNIPDTCLKSGSRANTLPSDHSFLVDEKLCWKVSALNSICLGTADRGILDETLPESPSMDLNISPDSDSIFFTMYSENTVDGLENNEDMNKSNLDTESLSNSHEVLKKTASKSEEELHQTHNGDKSQSFRAKLNMSEEGEENEDDPSMDEGFTKMPLPNSLDESKHSLSSLLVSCQQRDGT